MRKVKTFKNVNFKKVLQFNSKEVSKPPTESKEFSLECPIGGFYSVFVSKTSKGFTVYCGGNRHGTSSEPTFKIEHNFKTLNESLYYAHKIFLLNEISI